MWRSYSSSEALDVWAIKRSIAGRFMIDEKETAKEGRYGRSPLNSRSISRTLNPDNPLKVPPHALSKLEPLFHLEIRFGKIFAMFIE
jgi:hypothetical protein